MLKIAFVLPGYSKSPIGGYKMVFEYANRLADRNHNVSIAFDCASGAQRHPLPGFLKKLCYQYLVWHYPTWFSLNKRIHKICAYTGINDQEIPDGDIICATSVDTANPVSKLNSSKGKKVYFIQDFENWGGWTDEAVKDTYRLGMTNIVIAKWLQQLVKESGASSIVIPNGIDFTAFNVEIPIEKRTQYKIAMLYHVKPHKGSSYGIKALERLKEKYQDLQATVFGVPDRPSELPSWVQYVQDASQEQLRQIYNDAQIYLCPSIKEGFGLTGAEAMACGAAYVSSDYGGVHEYAVDGRNVLLSPPKDVNGLVEHVSYLFDHDEERIKLAQQGYEDIQKLDWKNSVDRLEKVLCSLTND